MNVLIIEDEKPASRRLVRLLEQAAPGTQVAAVLPSVEKSVNWLSTNSAPDLIFMDVQLEDGLCFEIFERYHLKTPVIFTTAYDAYTLKAFKVNSVDYLLKPVSEEDLGRAIGKYKEYYLQKNQESNLASLISSLTPKTKERFLVKIGEHFRSVPVSGINCFYIRERCNFLLTDQGKSYPVDYSLDKIEDMVDTKLFFRINRNAIINYNAISDVVMYSSSRLMVKLRGWTERDELLVSRERVGAFKEWMDR